MLDGTYGKRKRQRFRCRAPDGSFHRFVPDLPRQRVDDGVCDQCDNRIHVFQGPVVQRRGLYEVREIAMALIDVAAGRSYTQAARAVRVRYWGAGQKMARKESTVEGGQTVAEWLHQFGRVVIAPQEETGWPECVVLGSVVFQTANRSRDVAARQLFVVLAAWGYPDSGGPGRLWRLEARPTGLDTDWAEFLAALPGKPRSVVCDGDSAIVSGARMRWGGGHSGVPIHLCELHMRNDAMQALVVDGLGADSGLLSTVLASAFESNASWKRFVDVVSARPDAPATATWVSRWNARMAVQTARRGSLPAHYDCVALEAPLADVRLLLEKRKTVFRNRVRMNLLLGLLRLRINRHADPVQWAKLIRQHIAEHGGQSGWDRRLADPSHVDRVTGERVRPGSLRS